MKRPGHGKYGVAAKADRTYNHVVYHSKAEARRAQELDLLIRGGVVERWQRQVKFQLGLDVVYVVDFHVTNIPGVLLTEWVEDVKGHETREFKFKKKLWKKYGTMPLAIIKGRKVEWVRPVQEDKL